MSWFPDTSNFTNAEHLKGQLELFWPKHRNLTHKVGKILRKSLFFSLGKIGNWLLQNRNLSPGEGKWGTSNVDNLTRIYSLFFDVYLTYHHIPITVGFSLSFEFAIFGVQSHTPNLRTLSEEPPSPSPPESAQRLRDQAELGRTSQSWEY